MAFNSDFFSRVDTWVLGRRMYEVIVPWWTAVADGLAPEDAERLTEHDREFADLLRGMCKVVVSGTWTRGAPRPAVLLGITGLTPQVPQRATRPTPAASTSNWQPPL